jgi:hypothetical protein
VGEDNRRKEFMFFSNSCLSYWDIMLSGGN